MPYNVGSEEAVSIGELASVVARTCEPEVKVIVDKPATLGRPSHVTCAPASARARLVYGRGFHCRSKFVELLLGRRGTLL